MPYYWIIIWTKKRKAPFKGIRNIGVANINAVYNMVKEKAIENYRKDFIDVEVQMLSKLCKALQEFILKSK